MNTRCFNALHGLFLFLRRCLKPGTLEIMFRFNALHGLFLFLREIIILCLFWVIWLFQCPPRAFLISTKTSRQNNIIEKCFNALHGLFLFLLYDRKNLSIQNISFQCPSRAFLISTAASANPCKHCLPGPVLAGIYLNILTNSGSRGIFGMFTLCSYFSFSNCIDSVL